MTTSTTYVVKKHHMHWALLIGFLIIMGLAVAVTYLAGGGVHEESNGQYVITKPSLNTLRSRIVVRDQQGHLQAVPAPNGKTVTDGFGADGKLQRAETDRYDPIDKLTAAINANSDAMKASSEATDRSISNLKDEVTTSFKKVNDKIGTQIAMVDGKVKGLADKVEAEHTSVDALTKRVNGLETSRKVAEAPVKTPTQVARANTNFYLPPGIHLESSMASPANLAKIHRCLPPHRIEIDRSSPRCYVLRPGVRRCPNKCV